MLPFILIWLLQVSTMLGSKEPCEPRDSIPAAQGMVSGGRLTVLDTLG
jgi:hypothetical protein